MTKVWNKKTMTPGFAVPGLLIPVVGALALIALLPGRSAHAQGLMGWLDAAGVKPATVRAAAGKEQKTDSAMLLTLEPKENEMYPKPSPDGRSLLVVSSRGKHAWVSRRFAENGDPANIVTEDVRAFDSIGWRDNGHVYFFSQRMGGLGLWEKISDGEGMLRRLMEVRGRFTQPLLLPDGSLIAVRLSNTRPAEIRLRHQRHRDAFDNWSIAGFRGELVHIGKDGMRVLGSGINPALSPDGKWVVFSVPVGRSAHLFRMHPDGSELIQITDARSVDVQPAWSRDGRWIVFTSNRSHPDLRHEKRSNWDVWAISPEGRNLTRLTFDPARDGAPGVGADGMVYFHSDRKISARQRNAREVRRAEPGFHIWRIALPSAAGK